MQTNQQPESELKTSLDDVLSISVVPKLTLSKGAEICVPAVTVNLQNNSLWPELWMAPLASDSMPPSLADATRLLRSWLNYVGRDLVSCDVPELFFLSDRIAQQSRWPKELPQPPEDSILYRAGSYGMGVVSSIIGQPLANRIEDAGWNMLESFAKVTVFARTKTSQALEHPLARPFLPLIPEQIRSYFLNSAEAKALINEYDSAGHFLARFATELQSRLGARSASHAVSSDSSDTDFVIVVDQARSVAAIRAAYPSHFSGKPLTKEDFESWMGDDGHFDDESWDRVCMSIFSGGVEPGIRSQVWPLLLNSQNRSQSMAERHKVRYENQETYESLSKLWRDQVENASQHSPTDPHAHEAPVGDESETLDLTSKVLERKHRIEKDVVRTDRNCDFYAEVPEAAETFAGLPAGPNLVALRNVLMAYTMYNFELGYVQGMSDLCAPILAVMEDEGEAFWCFVGWMEKTKHHFARDQMGMKCELRRTELLLKLVDPSLFRHFENVDCANMFCCFRWLLICFKREFPLADINVLWEAAWASPLSQSHFVFVAVAILNSHRDALVALRAFDEVLKYINVLADRIHAPEALQHAEAVFWLARDLFISHAPAHLVEQLCADQSHNDRLAQMRAANPVDHSSESLHNLHVDSSLDAEEWEELKELFLE